MGKTVLLNRLRSTADEKGFRTARIEAPEGASLPQLLVPELRRLLHGLDLRQAATQQLRRAANVLAKFARGFKLKAVDVDLECSVDLSPGAGDSGNLERDLPRLLVALAAAAADRQTAIGLFIDEIQHLPPSELAAVIVACHEIAQRNPPFLFVGAGLPHGTALAGKAKSDAERLFDYPQMGALETDDARAALLKPAQAEGVAFEDAAAEQVLDAAENFPYFIQEWGFQVRNATPKSPITSAMVRAASPGVVPQARSQYSRAGMTKRSRPGLSECWWEHPTGP